jgi:hypothetical protein
MPLVRGAVRRSASRLAATVLRRTLLRRVPCRRAPLGGASGCYGFADDHHAAERHRSVDASCRRKRPHATPTNGGPPDPAFLTALRALRGSMIAPVSVSVAGIGELVNLGWLDLRDIRNKFAVADAVVDACNAAIEAGLRSSLPTGDRRGQGNRRPRGGRDDRRPRIDARNARELGPNYGSAGAAVPTARTHLVCANRAHRCRRGSGNIALSAACAGFGDPQSDAADGGGVESGRLH